MAKAVNSIIDSYDDVLDMSMSSTNYTFNPANTINGASGTVTIGSSYGSNGSYMVTNGTTSATTWTTSPYLTSTSTTPSITVSGNAEFDGDIKWKGRDLGKLLEKIEDRLAILTPDSKKLEQFAALKKAYDHYKLLEKLCEVEDDPKQ